MTTRNQKTVTLNAAAHAEFAAAAAAEGVSVAAWLTAAGRQRCRRESARAYAEVMGDPQIAAELAAHDTAIDAFHTVSDAKLREMDRDAA